MAAEERRKKQLAVKCRFATSATTPCYRKHGESALYGRGMCVGCYTDVDVLDATGPIDRRREQQ